MQSEKQWFIDLINTRMAPYIQHLQTEHENTKNKKVKGPQKRQNQKVGVALFKLNTARKIKEKVDELVGHLDFLESSHLKDIKSCLLSYMDKPEEE